MDPLASEFPSWTPYHIVHNNLLNLIDPTGMSAENPSTLGRFFERVGNVLTGKSWNTNAEVEDAAWEKEFILKGNNMMDPIEVNLSKVDKKQAYGEMVPGDMDEALLSWPEAEEYGTNLERFPMQKGPGKDPKRLIERITAGMNHAKKWLGIFDDGSTEGEVKPQFRVEIDSVPRIHTDSTVVNSEGKVIRTVIDTTWVVRQKIVRNE